MRGPQIGLLWAKFRSEFPKVEEHPPLDPVIESFGIPMPPNADLRLELADASVPLRAWFLNERGNELIQIQQDRFIHNWRKIDENDEYPRYSRLISTFKGELEVFSQYLSEERLGELTFNQCEVTYVNHILPGEGWEKHGQVDKVLKFWRKNDDQDFIQEPEDIRLAVRYIIPGSNHEPVGRLHLSVTPLFRRPDGRPVMALTLTARCRPEVGTIEGAVEALNKAHEWVVRSFASVTTSVMHKIWERRDAC